MDEIDMQILKILQDDGMASHEEIGRRLNLSRPTIHQRVKKLEADGVIKKSFSPCFNVTHNPEPCEFVITQREKCLKIAGYHT